MQRRYACGGDPAVLQIRQAGSEPDAGGDDTAQLSARAYHRTQSVKLARTIADLAGCEEIQSAHLAEALHLRPSEVGNTVSGKIFELRSN